MGNICEKFKPCPEVYELCKNGKLYTICREEIYTEISNCVKDLKSWVESAGWDIEVTPELEGYVESELTFKRSDVEELMKVYGEVLCRLIKEEGLSLDDALEEAHYSDEVSDCVNNIVAKRLNETITKYFEIRATI